MRSLLLALALSLLLSGCAGSTRKVASPTLPPPDPHALDAMEQGVQAAKQQGGQTKAISLFLSAVKTDPQLWEARYNLGVLLAESGELAQAEEQLSGAVKLAPNAEDVVVALAEVRRRRGNAAGAADVLDKFVKAHPEAIAARIALVSALRDSKKLDEAIRQAREVLVRRPNDPDALAELALTHVARGDMDTAELLSEESLKGDHKSAVAERAAGLVALERGDDAVAFKHFETASELDPEDTTARMNIGTVLLEAGVYAGAEKEFRAVLAIKADDIPATIGLAAALRGQGKRGHKGPYLEAEKLLEGVLAREPDNLAANYNLAVLYADFLQQPEKAKPLFKRFLADAPEDHPARARAQKKLAAIK